MGWGDELMAAGEALRLNRSTGRRVVIVDREGRPRWSDVWDGIPFLSRTEAADTVRLVNAPGARPYVAAKSGGRTTWRPYAPMPAPLVPTETERRHAEPFRGCVLLGPHVPEARRPNKEWPLDRWQAVADALSSAGARVVECSPPGAQRLGGVEACAPSSFRQACAVVAVARVLATVEGGLMHAAAAVGTPSVILWSEYVSPDVTGYANHTNLRHAGTACGSILPCRSCAASLDAITVEEVVDALRRHLAP